MQPSGVPSMQPSAQPSTQPSLQPLGQPSSQPSNQPSRRPSTQPSNRPSVQPSMQPSGVPSVQPSAQPSTQPSERPTGEWVAILGEGDRVKHVALISGHVWACGVNVATIDGSFCVSVEPLTGTQIATFPYRYPVLTSILHTKDVTKVVISGLRLTDSLVSADVALCTIKETQQSCAAKSRVGASFADGSYLPFVDKLMYVGAIQSLYASVSIADGITSAVRSFVYTSIAMSTITLLHVQSPPVFVGGFVAGTCVGTSGINYIYAGMVRSDTGVMTGMYLSPSSGSIRSSAGLVNAMALEFENPDSFIAGGIELSDGTGTQAYFVRVNSIYRKVIYGMRYLVQSERRRMQKDSAVTSAVRGMVIDDTSLYLLLHVQQLFGPSGSRHSASVLKTDMVSGRIIQQVHIYSNNASIQCGDMCPAGAFVVIACEVQYSDNITQAVVMSVNRQLALTALPHSFTRLEEDIFVTAQVNFKGTVLPLAMRIDASETTDYAFTVADGKPTFLPTVDPTSLPTSFPSNAPSGQPSSSPTSAPSISSQPTSQPSTSGPTNTYKPTAKPTLQPTARPSVKPTLRPSSQPSVSHTTRPSKSPSTRPSNIPSATPTGQSSTRPTFAPSAKPTRHPVAQSTSAPTGSPSMMPTFASTETKEQNRYRAREAMIFGEVTAGLVGLWVLYQLYRYCQIKVGKLRVDNKRVKEMVAQELPGRTRYPIFRAFVNLWCTLEADTEVPLKRSIDVDNTESFAAPSAGISLNRGAYIDSPAKFIDLEANATNNNHASNSSIIISIDQKKSGEQVKRVDEPMNPLPAQMMLDRVEVEMKVVSSKDADTHESEVSDFSEAGSADEGSLCESLSRPEIVCRKSSGDSCGFVHGACTGIEGACATADWYELEPSDDGDVVYSISSDDESIVTKSNAVNN